MLTCGDGVLPDMSRNDNCRFEMFEIERLFIQKQYNTGTTLNEIVLINAADGATVTDASLLATWQALFAKTDNEKVVVTPILNIPATEEAATTFIGGTGETARGVKKPISTPNTPFSAEVHDAAPKTIKSVRSFEGKIIGAYMLNSKGYLYGYGTYEDVSRDDGNGGVEVTNKLTKLRPIPITAFNFGSKTLGGVTTFDKNKLSFEMFAGWDGEIAGVSVNFDHWKL